MLADDICHQTKQMFLTPRVEQLLLQKKADRSFKFYDDIIQWNHEDALHSKERDCVQSGPWSQDVAVQCNFKLSCNQCQDSVQWGTARINGDSYSEEYLYQDNVDLCQQVNEHSVFDVNIVMNKHSVLPPISNLPVSSSPAAAARDDQVHHIQGQKHIYHPDSNSPSNQYSDKQVNGRSKPSLLPCLQRPKSSVTNELVSTSVAHRCQSFASTLSSNDSACIQQKVQNFMSSYASETTVCNDSGSVSSSFWDDIKLDINRRLCRKRSLIPISEESSTCTSPIAYPFLPNAHDLMGISHHKLSDDCRGRVWEKMMTAVMQPGSHIPRAPGLAPRFAMMDHRRTTSAPSKLEQLQAQFQQKLLKEKEEKMIQMYEHSAHHAIQKTTHNSYSGSQPTYRSKTNSPPTTLPLPPLPNGATTVKKVGSVRDFFNQRRNNDNGWVPTQPQNNDYWMAQNMRSPGAPRRPVVGATRGRDKGQPLAPIQHNPRPEQPKQIKGVMRTNSNQRQPNMTMQYRNNQPEQPKPLETKRPAPLPAISPQAQENGKLSNFQKWKKEQARNKVKNDIEIEMCEPKQKPSDFQKWQQEQDRQREERLKNHEQQNGRVASGKATPEERRKLLMMKNRKGSFTQFTDEEDEEPQSPASNRSSSRVEDDIIAKKKKELMEMIAKEQAQLAKMKQEREKEAAKAEKEAEREKKRQQAEQDRMKQLRDAMEEQQRQQEQEAEELERHKVNMQRSAKLVRESPEPVKTKAPAKKPTRPIAKPAPPPAEDEGPEPPKIDNTAFYAQLANQASAHTAQEGDLAECSICGRKFASDRLQKHMNICAKSSNKKRKVFDPVKMRTEGTEQEKFVKEAKRRPSPPPQPKKNNWRKKHEEFMKMMQYNKKMAEVEAAGGNLADLPPPPPTENPDYVQCPTCQRKFNPTAAERHIPKCQNIKARPPPPKARAR